MHRMVSAPTCNLEHMARPTTTTLIGHMFRLWLLRHVLVLMDTVIEGNDGKIYTRKLVGINFRE